MQDVGSYYSKGTGKIMKNHIHFEIYISKGKYVKPDSYIASMEEYKSIYEGINSIKSPMYNPMYKNPVEVISGTIIINV